MDISDAKLTVMAYSANPKIRQHLFFQHGAVRDGFRVRGSAIGRVVEALVRFWDRGGEGVDALYDTRMGMSHFMESDGASVQYYGDNSALKPAPAYRDPAAQAEETPTGAVLESEARFAQSPAPVRKPGSKAS